MKRIVLAMGLSLGFVAGAPIIAPDHGVQASADDDAALVIYRKSFPFIIEYTWQSGRWVITNVWYDMSIGF